jgi:hypothetical protein
MLIATEENKQKLNFISFTLKVVKNLWINGARLLDTDERLKL